MTEPTLEEQVEDLAGRIAALHLDLSRLLHPTFPRVDVTRCARCGHDHEQVPFKQMQREVDQGYDPPLTHWAPCPRTGDPILMFMVEDGA